MDLLIRPALSGKTAVVTGGSGVLCRVFCRALAACGAKVAVLNRTLEKGEAVAAAIRAEGGEAMAVAADVTDMESLKRAHEEIVGAFGPCRILINGAGGNRGEANTEREFFIPADGAAEGGFFDLDEKAFSSVVDLNLLSTFRATQVFSRDMAGGGGGVVVNISSINAFTPLTKIPAYSAAKAGVSNFTQWLAVHFAKAGIRVNALVPGFFSTEQNRTLLWREDGTPTVRAEKIIAGTPMGRMGKPEELIGALLWLIDDKSAGFVTGAVIPVDGGFSAYSGV